MEVVDDGTAAGVEEILAGAACDLGRSAGRSALASLVASVKTGSRQYLRENPR
jgi:hypothetical protein